MCYHLDVNRRLVYSRSLFILPPAQEVVVLRAGTVYHPPCLEGTNLWFTINRRLQDPRETTFPTGQCMDANSTSVPVGPR